MCGRPADFLPYDSSPKWIARVGVSLRSRSRSRSPCVDLHEPPRQNQSANENGCSAGAYRSSSRRRGGGGDRPKMDSRSGLRCSAPLRSWRELFHSGSEDARFAPREHKWINAQAGDVTRRDLWAVLMSNPDTHWLNEEWRCCAAPAMRAAQITRITAVSVLTQCDSCRDDPSLRRGPPSDPGVEPCMWTMDRPTVLRVTRSRSPPTPRRSPSDREPGAARRNLAPRADRRRIQARGAF